jgi:hypothetical protein
MNQPAPDDQLDQRLIGWAVWANFTVVLPPTSQLVTSAKSSLRPHRVHSRRWPAIAVAAIVTAVVTLAVVLTHRPNPTAGPFTPTPPITSEDGGTASQASRPRESATGTSRTSVVSRPSAVTIEPTASGPLILVERGPSCDQKMQPVSAPAHTGITFTLLDPQHWAFRLTNNSDEPFVYSATTIVAGFVDQDGYAITQQTALGRAAGPSTLAPGHSIELTVRNTPAYLCDTRDRTPPAGTYATIITLLGGGRAFISPTFLHTTS